MKRALVLAVLAGCFIKPSDDGAGSSACPGTFPICDGFEDATIGGWSQDVNLGGSVTLDAAHVRAGAQAVRLTLPQTTAVDYPYAGLVHSLPTHAVFVRAFVWLDELQTTRGTTLIDVDTHDTGELVGVIIDGGMLAIDNSNFASPPFPLTRSTTAIETRAWNCIELGVEPDAGTVAVWFDGAPVPELSAGGATRAFTDLAVRISAESPFARDFNVWIDEVAVDDHHIGCDL